MPFTNLTLSTPDFYTVTAGENVNVTNGCEWSMRHQCAETFTSFMERRIMQLADMGRYRTSETYRATLHSFSAFCGGRSLLPSDITADVVSAYEKHLLGRGLSPNTTSFYMRILRAVYNSAVDCGLTVQRAPFGRVYTGIGRTVKRAVPMSTVRRLKNLDLSGNPSLELTRDLFMFSFYTRGMSFVDMAYLRKSDLSGGILSYRRHKTGRRLEIKWEGCMQQIVDRYTPLTGCGMYLLPILGDGENTRRSYQSALRRVNRNLKILGRIVGSAAPLTTYVARHTWASSARSYNIPIAVISEGMGHESEVTTRIYLKSLEGAVVNRANARIIGALK